MSKKKSRIEIAENENSDTDDDSSRIEIAENENSDTDDDSSDDSSENSSSGEDDDSDDEALSDSEIIGSDDEDEAAALIGWKQISPNTPVETSRFPLTAKPGITVSVNENWKQLDYLKLFLDTDIMTTIMQETNRYAQQYLAGKKLTANQLTKYGWYPVTIDELWVFFSIIIYQAIIIKPKQRWYWTKNKTFETPFVRDVMSVSRFEKIMKFLHFTDNEAYDPETHPCPKLRKIWEIYQAINKNFERLYIPEQEVSIDESLMAFKGRLSWKQFIPSKRARFGCKSVMMCESKSGYILKSIIYTGKETEKKKDIDNVSVTTAIVLEISKNLLHQGYTLVMDNFYNSPELFELLSASQTDAYGTLRVNRKGLPEKFSKTKLKKDQAVCWIKKGLTVMKWRDKRDVSLISTFHDVSFQETKNKLGQKKIKPQIVVDYNKTMGGVDRADQQMSTYSLMRKQQKKYYIKIFRHLLEQSLFNAYVLHKKYAPDNGEHLTFLTQIMAQIIQKHQTNEEPTAKRGRPRIEKNLFGGSTPTRLTARHFPKTIPATEKKQNPTRRCIVCCSKREGRTALRKETRYCCEECGVGLCPDPCFKIYHTQEEY